MRTVFDFGAVGDGVADDTAAFQSAANTGRLIAPASTPSGEAATYKITGTVNVGSCHVTIDGVVDATGRPAGTTWGQGFVFSASGTAGAPSTISSSVSSLTSTLQVSGQPPAGTLVIIKNSERPIPGLTRTDRSKGELRRVKSSTATNVILATRTYFNYASPSTVSVIDPVSPRFDGQGTILCGGVGSGHTAINITYGLFPVVEDLTILGAEDMGVAFDYCWAPVARGLRVEGCTSPSYGNSGYGILLGAGTFGGRAEACRLFNCRHGVSGGGAIPAMYCTVEGCFAENATLDAHEPTFEWVFSNNTVVGSIDGLLLRGQHSDAVGNRFFDNSGGALRIKTWDQVTVQEGMRSLFNRVKGSGSGILADGAATELDPVSRKPGLELVGDRVETSGKPGAAAVTVAWATEATVDVVTGRNTGAIGVKVTDSRLRRLSMLGSDVASPTVVENTTIKDDQR